MDHCWNAYIAQQCQRNHGVRMAKYAVQIGDRTAHLVHMYTNPAYWYSHYCIVLRIDSLIKEMTKGKMSMHVCTSKIGTHRSNFEAKSRPYFHPLQEYSMMTHLHAHVLNIPWIMESALRMGSLANVLTALASELRAASPVRLWSLDCGPRAAVSAHSTQARRRTGSRRRRMEQRCLLGGLRSGALEEGLGRRTQGPPADGEAGWTMVGRA
jgi:hypothetical protein